MPAKNSAYRPKRQYESAVDRIKIPVDWKGWTNAVFKGLTFQIGTIALTAWFVSHGLYAFALLTGIPGTVIFVILVGIIGPRRT